MTIADCQPVDRIKGGNLPVKRAKRIERLKRLPANMRYSELAQILEDLGATHVRTKGSHHSWRVEGLERPLVIAVHNDVVEIEVLKDVVRIFNL